MLEGIALRFRNVPQAYAILILRGGDLSAWGLQFLLDAGADKTIRDANGDSPQSWASWHWRPKPLIDLLDPRSVGILPNGYSGTPRI